MNILIVSQYFWPESFLINNLATKIRALGHQVAVFTGKPNYPDGEIFSGYTKYGIQEETFANDIPVFRVPIYPRKNGGGKNLILNYFSFVFSGMKHSFKYSKNKQFDLILVFAPSPITSAIPAILLKWRTKSHLAIWIQDLWPESLQATGFIRNRYLIQCLRWMVRGIYRLSDTLLVQSKAFIPPVSKLCNNNKIYYYPNSVADDFSDHSYSGDIPKELASSLENYFSVVFAGNLGVAQSVETIIKAAELLKHQTHLKIILIGSGSKTDWIKQYIIDNDLNNVVLPGRFPPELMPFIFSKASGLLVTLKQDEIFKYTIPSKIQSYLASGKPIIASLDGEGANVIQEAGAGLTSPAEDANLLAKNILSLYNLPPAQREEMGKSGRSYFLKHFELEEQCKRLIEIFEHRLQAATG